MVCGRIFRLHDSLPQSNSFQDSRYQLLLSYHISFSFVSGMVSSIRRAKFPKLAFDKSCTCRRVWGLKFENELTNPKFQQYFSKWFQLISLLSFLHNHMVECWNMDFSVCCQVSFFLRFSSWKMRKIVVLKVNWCLQIWWIYNEFPWHKRIHHSWYPHMGRFSIRCNLEASKHSWRWRKPPEQGCVFVAEIRRSPVDMKIVKNLPLFTRFQPVVVQDFHQSYLYQQVFSSHCQISILWM